jgi:hypothetical protein
MASAEYLVWEATQFERHEFDVDTRCADLYRKGMDGMWVLHPFEAGQPVHLASVKLDITADALFAEVEPGPAAAPLATGG